MALCDTDRGTRLDPTNTQPSLPRRRDVPEDSPVVLLGCRDRAANIERNTRSGVQAAEHGD